MDSPETDSLAAFLGPLLSQGRAVVMPDPAPRRPSRRAISLLDEAFATHRLDVAGPPIAFDPAVAAAAAEVVRRACEALVDRSQRTEDLATALKMPRPPRSASEHLSADLMFRYLPQVHRRVRGLDPTDPLVAMLVHTLREWPLSGALADLADPPASPPDFGAHQGLMMLYAERLVARRRESWYPDGVAGEYIDLARRFASEGVA